MRSRPLRVGRPGDPAGVVGDDRPVAVVLLDVPEDRVDGQGACPASSRAWPDPASDPAHASTGLMIGHGRREDDGQRRRGRG